MKKTLLLVSWPYFEKARNSLFYLMGISLLIALMAINVNAQSVEGTACDVPSVLDLDDPFPRSVNIPQYDDCPTGSGENCAPLQIIGGGTMDENCFFNTATLETNGNTVVRNAAGEIISGRTIEIVPDVTFYLCKPGVGLKATDVSDAVVCCDCEVPVITGMSVVNLGCDPTLTESEDVEIVGDVVATLANGETVPLDIIDPAPFVFVGQGCERGIMRRIYSATNACDGECGPTVTFEQEIRWSIAPPEALVDFCPSGPITVEPNQPDAAFVSTFIGARTNALGYNCLAINLMIENTAEIVTCVEGEQIVEQTWAINFTTECGEDIVCDIIYTWALDIEAPVCDPNCQELVDCECVDIEAPVCDPNCQELVDCECVDIEAPVCDPNCQELVDCECVDIEAPVCDPNCQELVDCECVDIEAPVCDPNCQELVDCECVDIEAPVCDPNCQELVDCECVDIEAPVCDPSCEELDEEICACVPTTIKCGNNEVFNSSSCECDPITGTDPCETVTISVENGGVTISNLTAAIEILTIFNSSWKAVYTCSANCNDTEIIPLKDGSYYVSIRFFNSSWGAICSMSEQITVSGSTHGELVTQSCGEVNITYGNGQINLEGVSGEEYFFKVLPRFGSWTPVLNCVSSCGDAVELNNLESGAYSIDVWTSSWGRICSSIIELNAGSSDTSGDDTPDTSGDDTPDTSGDDTPDTSDDDTPDTSDDDTPDTSGLETAACGEVTVTYGNGLINIKGIAGNDYRFKILQRYGDWKSVLNCTGKCGNEAEVDGLPAGQYQITILDHGWSRVCDDIVVELKSGYVSGSATSRKFAGNTNSITLANPNRDYSIYPNPTKNEVFINLNTYGGQKGSIQLLNQLGQVVQQMEYDKIPAETLRMELLEVTPGLHFINIRLANDTVITEKLLIQ